LRKSLKKKDSATVTIYGICLTWITLLSFLAFGPTSVMAAGLSTRFGEVTVTNLCIGHRYSMEETAKLPLAIHNTSSSTVELKVDPMLPTENELKRGYEPMPDLSWISIERDAFTIAPHEYGSTDIFVAIPPDEQFLGKKYQIFIWSRTTGTSIGVGIKSKLLIDIASQTCEQVPSVKPHGDFDFVVEPHKLIVQNVKLGEVFDLERERGVALTISNTSAVTKKFSVRSIPVSESYADLPPGYDESPSPSFLNLEPGPHIEILPDSTATVKMQLSLPMLPDHAGKNYLFIIEVAQNGAAIYIPLYVTTTD
jgi:hypothetical protein